MAQNECFFEEVRRRTFICCRNVHISASSAARDRIRSTTIQPMSLQRSLIAHDHRPILDRLPSKIRFATGTVGSRPIELRCMFLIDNNEIIPEIADDFGCMTCWGLEKRADEKIA